MNRTNRTRITALAAAVAVSACARDRCPSGMHTVGKRSHPPTSLYCESSDGKRASWFEYYDAGGRKQECSYIDGRAHGAATLWYSNGQKWLAGRYLDGNKVGVWTQWGPAGERAAQGQYRDGQFVAGAPIAAAATCEKYAPIR